MTTTNQTALVTGATSGIGHEIAVLLAKDMAIVADAFRSAGSPKITWIEKDLFEPGAAEELYDDVKAKGIEINILVNDAGQGVYGLFAETDLQAELDIIQLNISALVVLTKLFLKDMIARKEGKILQLASVVSKISSPLMAVYAGTKAFVYNFSQSLINELKDTGVTLTALQPVQPTQTFSIKPVVKTARLSRKVIWPIRLRLLRMVTTP